MEGGGAGVPGFGGLCPMVFASWWTAALASLCRRGLLGLGGAGAGWGPGFGGLCPRVLASSWWLEAALAIPPTVTKETARMVETSCLENLVMIRM